MSDALDPLTTMIARMIADDVAEKVIDRLNESLELQRKLIELAPKTGEVRRKDVVKDLVSSETLTKWEKNGLNPIYRGGGTFYLLEELHKFKY